MPTPVLDRTSTGRRFLVAAVVCLFALGLTCAVFVGTPFGQAFDSALLPLSERGASYEQDSALLEPAKAVLSVFGDRVVLAVVLLVVVLLSRRLWTSVAAVGVVLGSVATARVLKEVVVRPDLDVVGSSTHNSFPSGHVAVATALLLAFALVLPRWWVLVPGAVVVVVVAASTMITGWHRLSDLVGGALVAAVLYCLAATALADDPAPVDS
ncbi:phosphatase PAP2 family protein [Umezawaea endophytica]|uniref:Phosphatase PAP2 family protein n=1 Tax=Umezawaea endophytica TaxID=1654476 RepID=A0A9X2VW85_9PSEU|nr:phosphatase PAP2 family protein [Umezawaea endophytica]MCS7483337.1 phosphatase PAP2 family protein [Umezawaea endophytica]